MYMNILSGRDNTSATGVTPYTVGATYLDPSLLSGYTSFKFEGIMALASAATGLTGSMQLYNASSNTVVATLTTISATESLITSSVISIPVSATTYESRIFVNDASTTSNVAIAFLSRLKFS
jgi:hypothetical protein